MDPAALMEKVGTCLLGFRLTQVDSTNLRLYAQQLGHHIIISQMYCSLEIPQIQKSFLLCSVLAYSPTC